MKEDVCELLTVCMQFESGTSNDKIKAELSGIPLLPLRE